LQRQSNVSFNENTQLLRLYEISDRQMSKYGMAQVLEENLVTGTFSPTRIPHGQVLVNLSFQTVEHLSAF